MPRFRISFALATVVFSLLVSTSAFSEPHDRQFAIMNQWAWENDSAKLTWNSDSNASQYKIYRRLAKQSGYSAANDWGWALLATLNGSASSYGDESAQPGLAYEYALTKELSIESNNYTGHGFMYAGEELPLANTRGRVLLLVESGLDTALAEEIKQYKRALVGDLWQVVHRTVGGKNSASPQQVKAIIQEEYDKAPSSLKSVILLGSLPEARSGRIAPDGHHNDHWGAWSTLAYFQDVAPAGAAQRWSDDKNFNTTNSLVTNVAGDGRWDISTLDEAGDGALFADLEMGLIDLSDLEAFSESEVELYRRYIKDKLLPFRLRQFSVPGRAIVQAQFTWNAGRIPSVSAWRDFAPMVGRDNIIESNYSDLLKADNASFWSLASNTGSFTNVSAIVSVYDLATGGPRYNVAQLTHGSWHGDFHGNSAGNVNRAFLAAKGYTLAATWTGRPHSMYYPASMGFTLGYGARKALNGGQEEYFNSRGFDENVQQIHYALMGDPTLRMHYAEPVQELAVSSDNGSAVITWAAPSQSAGYRVYRSSSEFGPYTLLTPQATTQTRLQDFPGKGQHYYMVVSLQLQQSPTGSYWNNSTGIIASVTLGEGAGSPPSPPSNVSITASQEE